MSSAWTSYRSRPRKRDLSLTTSRLLFLAQTLRWFVLGLGLRSDRDHVRGSNYAHSVVGFRLRLSSKTAFTLLLPQLRHTLKTEQRGRSATRPCLQNCRLSPRAISTGQLHTLLHFHLRPIKQVVFLCPYSLKDERSHLRGSFTLRCFQRLSRPYLATQLCPWQDNWCTRGTSIPVLSY